MESRKLIKVILFGSSQDVVDDFMTDLLKSNFQKKIVTTAPMISLYINSDNSGNSYQYYYISTARGNPEDVLERNNSYFEGATSCILVDPDKMQENAVAAIINHSKDLRIPVIDVQLLSKQDILQNIKGHTEGALLLASEKEWQMPAPG